MFSLPIKSSAPTALVSQQHLKALPEVSIPLVAAHTAHRCPKKLAV